MIATSAEIAAVVRQIRARLADPDNINVKLPAEQRVILALADENATLRHLLAEGPKL